MSQRLACVLCGAEGGEVTVRLVEWREPIGGRTWENLPRCRDVEACWTRVIDVLREDWPVNDGRPARAPAEPLQPAPPPPADARTPAEEEIPWLNA